MYVFTKPLPQELDVTQGQFLSGENPDWIQNIPSFRPIVMLKLKRLVWPTKYS